MDALWRTLEALRQDPGTGMSVFWRDHADHHMNVLLDADGPFKGSGSNGATTSAPGRGEERGAPPRDRSASLVTKASDAPSAAGEPASWRRCY